jgi:hypothetical protein
MNGSGLSKTSLKDGQLFSNEDQTKRDEKELERFAATIAGCLQQTVGIEPSALGFLAPEPTPMVPADWRPSVEPLTPGCATGTGCGTGAECAASAVAEDPRATLQPNETERIQVRVRSEEFGEIALVVERADAGLRVVLSAEDPGAIATLRAESRAVRQALEADGQCIGSLEIVRMDGLGTNLAQAKSSSSNRARRLQESAEPGETPNQRRKKSKRLDLIG